MIAKIAGIVIALVVGAGVSSAQPAVVVSGNDEQLLKFARENLAAFNEPPIEDAVPDTYRLVWHPAHMNAAVISAYSRGGNSYLRISQTDGYGTYTVGKLKDVGEAEIANSQFERIATSFRALADLVPLGREPAVWPDGKARICLHSSSYALESRVGNEARIISRWCHPDFSRDFGIAEPLVFLAREKFPKQMMGVDPDFGPAPELLNDDSNE